MGIEEHPIENVKLIDCQFANIRKENVFEFVKGLVLEDVTVNGEELQHTVGINSIDRVFIFIAKKVS